MTLMKRNVGPVLSVSIHGEIFCACFQNPEAHSSSICRQLRLHSQRQRDIAFSHMPRLDSVNDGHIVRSQYPHDDLLQGVRFAFGWQAVQHLAEDKAAYMVKLSRHLKLPEH